MDYFAIICVWEEERKNVPSPSLFRPITNHILRDELAYVSGGGYHNICYYIYNQTT